MTDAAWVRGMGELVLGLARADETREKASARGQLYRKHLDDLSDEAWLYAVDGAMKTCTFFPTIAELRAAALEWRPESAGYLPPARRTEEEAQADRVAAKEGLKMVEAAWKSSCAANPPAPRPPAVALPLESATVEATEDRLALLRAQADQIQGDEVSA